MAEQEQVSTDTSVENASPESEADAKPQESEAEPTPAAVVGEEKTDSEKATGNAVGARIKQLTDRNRSDKQSHDAEMFALRQENDRLEKSLKDRPAVPDPLKTIEDFDHDETQYREYLDKRTTSIAETAASEAVGKVQTQIESSQTEQGFRSKETAFEATVDDYADAVYGLDTNGNRKWAASDAMTGRIRVSDIGPELAYHLAKNPGTALEIASLTSRDDVVARMTTLEASLKSEQAKVSKTVSDTPPPTPKLPGGETALDKGFHKDMSDSDFNKMRRKEIANR